MTQVRERFGIQMAGMEMTALLHLKAGLEELPEQVITYVGLLMLPGLAAFCPHNGIEFSHEKEGSSDTCYNMDES